MQFDRLSIGVIILSAVGAFGTTRAFKDETQRPELAHWRSCWVLRSRWLADFVQFLDWWYFITVKEFLQQQIGLLEALVWLTLGPGEGFLIGVFSGLAFEKWRAKKLAKASVAACRE